ncbi:hypothetical protein HHK36_000363 [Tetracentron sinense]|uniref:Pectinesterase inhibitor domain-containing protein n=1 Tax=Tetracentron sinense TaxID=13715 RepID=A0A834ZRT2_TETSI|nr:hypothetical protein HHK36_000363 [Tetracentron sinense]
MEGSSSYYALATLLIVVIFTSAMNSCSATRAISASKTSIDFIRTSCGTTTYPKLCYTSLSIHASAIQTSPKLLANTALSVSLSKARDTSTMLSKLSKSYGLKPREVSAMRDCVEEMNDSIEELHKSIEEMGQEGGSNFGLQMNDIQTWVSAALTDEDTCVDGFAGKVMNGNVKTTVRSHIVNVAQLTSNALALINSYASIQATSP